MIRKSLISVSFFLFFFFFSAFSQNIEFSKWFFDQACRLDFVLTGNSQKTEACLREVSQEAEWGGRRNHLNSSLNLGEYNVTVHDSATNELIYVDGFSSLYFEWQTTAEAKKMNKAFEQTITLPFPQNTVKVIISKRINLDEWTELTSFMVNPKDELINRAEKTTVPVKSWINETDPSKAVDIVILAEGYSRADSAKFFKDAARLKKRILTHEPFKKYENRLNFRAVASFAEVSGISRPDKGTWVESALSAHYHTFYAPRYLTTQAVFKTRDYAGQVPYDAIYILANSKIYGGGGIYNHYALTASNGPKATYVTVHEFGHSFAGLGDEYFREGADVLDAMYNTSIEPWEPNITSLVNFDRKWKDMVPEGIHIPTADYDSAKVAVGVFEGGGYLTRGMYRPAYTCRMKDNTATSFCPVCEAAVERMILFLTE